ncbi:hypothetical protein NOCARDAX2BIS_340084 [Nocardioides sp. AX2bis]|nr:hypothetical protein NOCARDAX2BIS_340084 [Nocardioides sp. AX2bis]
MRTLSPDALALRGVPPGVSPPAAARPTTPRVPRRHHRRGRQDSFEAPGQGPGPAVPHRRRRQP